MVQLFKYPRIKNIKYMKLEGNTLIADKGKDLFCTFNEINYGNEVTLGLVFFDKENKKLKIPYLLKKEDFEERETKELQKYTKEYVQKLIEKNNKKEFTYGNIKEAVVMEFYSHSDQIALMINYQDNPEKYKEEYKKMQKLREFASIVASKYSK